jgi:sugar/nucleoside kinase (ribokinase family)
MNSRFDVLTIGNAIVDVISKIEDKFLDENKIVKGSMTLVDEDRAHDLYQQMGPATEISGGSAANTAVGVSSFGAQAAFAGKIKADQLGEVFRHDITAADVAFETPDATTGPATARSLILVTPDGERTMNTFLGACAEFCPDDVDEQMVCDSKVTYLEGYLWDPEPAKNAFLKAAKIARDANREVSLTLSDGFCVDRYRDSFLELVKRDIDILFANEDEIKSLYQVDNFDDALQAVRADCKLAALTRSRAGSVIVSPDEIHVIEAFKVEKVVDTTGAGDMFAAGFLSGYTKGKSLAQSARLGSLAASEIISHIGARPLESFSGLASNHGLL